MTQEERQEEIEQQERQTKEGKRTTKNRVYKADRRFFGARENGNHFGKWLVSQLDASGKSFRHLYLAMGMSYPDRLAHAMLKQKTQILLTPKELYDMAHFLEVPYAEVIGHFSIEEPNVDQMIINQAYELLDRFEHHLSKANRNVLLEMAYTMQVEQESQEKGS